MKRDDAEIERTVREQFPLYFGDRETIEYKAYATRRDAVIDYAEAVSGAPLSAETVRYQSILLISTLLFVSFGFLHVNSFKLVDSSVTLDATAFGFYNAFLVAVGVIFSVKAWVDFTRSGISREKNSDVIFELQNQIAIGQLREQIERFFREEVEAAIGEAYAVYSQHLERVCGIAQKSSVWPRAIVIDESKLQTIPELAQDIERHRDFLNNLQFELGKDVVRFSKEVGEINVPDTNDRYASKTDAYPRVQEIFEDTLGPWLNARRRWVDRGLDATISRVETNKVNAYMSAHLETLKRIVFVRRVYFWLEIVLPLLFSTSAMLVTDIHLYRSGLPSPAPVEGASTR